MVQFQFSRSLIWHLHNILSDKLILHVFHFYSSYSIKYHHTIYSNMRHQFCTISHNFFPSRLFGCLYYMSRVLWNCSESWELLKYLYIIPIKFWSLLFIYLFEQHKKKTDITFWKTHGMKLGDLWVKCNIMTELSSMKYFILLTNTPHYDFGSSFKFNKGQSNSRTATSPRLTKLRFHCCHIVGSLIYSNLVKVILSFGVIKYWIWWDTARVEEEF